MNSNYKLFTKDVGKAVIAIQRAFDKKRQLEKEIIKLIKDFEDDTGLAIDSVKYQRDITLPIKSPKYTDLTLIMTEDEG